MAQGRAGYLVHLALGAIFGIGLTLEHWLGLSQLTIALGTALIVGFACRLLAGFRNRSLGIYPLAALAGLAIGFLPFLTHVALESLFMWMGAFANRLVEIDHWLALIIGSFAGTFVFGQYLMWLSIFGIEQHQAFSVLAHPGYKHFVRLRVRRDGRTIDGWVLGKVDPLNAEDPVVLIDHFTWTNHGLSTGAKSAVLRGKL
jgi:hypothetical protein